MRQLDSPASLDFQVYHEKLAQIDPQKVFGVVRKAGGLVVESDGPRASVGEICEIHSGEAGPPILAQVIGFQENKLICMPIESMGGVRLGDRVVSRRRHPTVAVGPSVLGRVLDGNGAPLDGHGPVSWEAQYPLDRPAINPLQRSPIVKPLGTGVRAIDGLLTVGRGQRVGIFGGSGVGKSTLLGMMARYTEAGVNVISLVGERGREVSGFLREELGEDGLARSVVVVSTSDDPPLMRIRAALTATAIAEYFRDRGEDVLLVMDSVTRVAMAQREVGLAAGEPPSSKGYTPSVFALLPRLFERAGNFEEGSITGFYTVLVEGDDMSEPIADAVRGLLDGHIVLSRELAWKNHFPAIAILDSVSRLMNELADDRQREAAATIRQLLAEYQKAEDLINIGAYSKGTNPRIDLAIKKIDRIQLLLQQNFSEQVDRPSAVQELIQVASR